MFCNQCGVKLTGEDRFCPKCGNAVAPPASQVQHLPSTERVGESLSFGALETRLLLPFKGKKPFPAGYEWLEQRNTLLVYRNHLVLMQGDENRSTVLNVLGAAGLVGGVVSIIRGAKDDYLIKKFELSAEHAERLFADRRLVWCWKDDAVIWSYHEKPFMFIKSSSEQLYCKFNSLDGVLHACAVLLCTFKGGGYTLESIKSMGCKFVDIANNIPEKMVPEAMEASRRALPG